MSDRYLITVVTPGYVSRAVPYFKSLPVVVSAKPIVILLDFNEQTDPGGKIEAGLRSVIDWVEYRHMALPASHSSMMVQHNFLDALPDLPDDALVCLTDADIVIQRDFYPAEWEWLENLNRKQIGVWWNCLETDNLELEAKRIGLSDEWTGRYDECLRKIPCMNCGVMVARAGTFRDVQKVYQQFCMEFYRHAPHRSRCQFLLNYCWHLMGLEVVTLLPPIHQHGHCRDQETGDILLPAGAHMRAGTLMWQGVPVIFRHNFPTGE